MNKVFTSFVLSENVTNTCILLEGTENYKHVTIRTQRMQSYDMK